MTTGVQVFGIDEANTALTRIDGGAVAASRLTVRIGSGLVYAFGIETGRHRGGRLARRAGGVRYLSGAVQRVLATPGIDRTIASDVAEGPEGGKRAIYRLAFAIQGHARALIQAAGAIRSGALWNSIEIDPPSAGGRVVTSLARGGGRATVRSDGPRVSARSRVGAR